MRDAVTRAVEDAAQEWKREAAERKRISAHDPVAEALEYCAGDLAERLRVAAASDSYLTVEAYAAQPDVGVTPQTVRAWIRAGELDAVRGRKGYMIRAGAVRVLRQRRSA